VRDDEAAGLLLSLTRISSRWPSSVNQDSVRDGSQGARKSRSSRTIAVSAAASSRESGRVVVTPAPSQNSRRVQATHSVLPELRQLP
jgi:hypothetical protein